MVDIIWDRTIAFCSEGLARVHNFGKVHLMSRNLLELPNLGLTYPHAMMAVEGAVEGPTNDRHRGIELAWWECSGQIYPRVQWGCKVRFWEGYNTEIDKDWAATLAESDPVV